MYVYTSIFNMRISFNIQMPPFQYVFFKFAWCNLTPPAYAPGPKALPKTLDFPMHINTDFVRSNFAGKV